MRSIDVVIPTFNRWEITEGCLRHLRGQTISHSVIVVDNGSTDGTPENIRTSFPEVRVIELEANLGFPVACNRGAAGGIGEIVVLINNDVEPRPDFLEKLVSPFEDLALGSTAALLVQPGGQTIDSMGLTADSTLASFPRLRRCPVGEAGSRDPVLAGPCGGGGAYRRTAWEGVGGLDEGVLFYGEDLDLALRIRSAGWRTLAVPDAVAVHLGSATAGHRSSWQRYHAGFARGYFLRRYRLFSTRSAFRTLLTESIVMAGDAAISRDLSAIRGRIAGWHAANGVEPRAMPPRAALDRSITFFESLRLRRTVYFG